ncbi:hypothetical protein MNBD_BACTEROID03-375 [hydrothermal vent metagenome]|uniref:Uncharacterized protein n=1 Tax=hydrothermal vent metagenome TaxID=652676 RepID=A0A3B0SY31_9ZZZZ
MYTPVLNSVHSQIQIRFRPVIGHMVLHIKKKTVARCCLLLRDFVSFMYGISKTTNLGRQHLRFAFTQDKADIFHSDQYTFRPGSNYRGYKKALHQRKKHYRKAELQ